jgi:hypothetical protein
MASEMSNRSKAARRAWQSRRQQAKPASLAALMKAAKNVRRCYLNWGPVDDGSPEGKAFEESLDDLLIAILEAKHDRLTSSASINAAKKMVEVIGLFLDTKPKDRHSIELEIEMENAYKLADEGVKHGQ